MFHQIPVAILDETTLYLDSATALVIDGEIVPAAREVRFTRLEHNHAFPTNAIDCSLRGTGLQPEELDYVGFLDKPCLKSEWIPESNLACARVGCRSYLSATPL
jgi:carbamoyltransferase